jgi:hypothetical protein
MDKEKGLNDYTQPFFVQQAAVYGELPYKEKAFFT